MLLDELRSWDRPLDTTRAHFSPHSHGRPPAGFKNRQLSAGFATSRERLGGSLCLNPIGLVDNALQQRSVLFVKIFECLTLAS